MGEAALVSAGTPSEGVVGVVVVSGLSKTYGAIRAIDGVSFEVRRGELFGLIGSDGSGKSSILKTVAGVQTFDAGLVRVLDTTLDSDAACERIKDRIGLMPQGLGQNLYGELTVEENIDFFARLRLVDETALAERKAALLAMTRLTDFRDRPMKHLSGGMKQKLGLVCTLIHDPQLVILDEPTTGVDPVSRRDFWTILSNLVHERGITALISTAYMDEASRFHRVALVHKGRIVVAGEPDAIHAQAPGGEPNAAASLEDVFVALIGGTDGAEGEAPRATALRLPPETAAKAIEASALTCDFGAFRAADNVSFSVAPGEIFGLLGANGAGKTTVIKMLTGIIRPSHGSGYVAGADMRRAQQHIKERIGYMSQAFSLYTDLTVIENILLYAGIYGLEKKEAAARIDWAMRMAGLHGKHDVIAAELPMGLRQRLALGCALLHRPQVLFLDEPTSGVDPIGRRRFWRILFELAREDGVAILVTTHHMSEAEYCDRLALMHAGRIVADASPEELKRATEQETGALLEITVPSLHGAMQRLTDAGYSGVSLHGRNLHLFTHSPEPDSERILALFGKGATAIVRPLSIEDVFVHRITRLEKPS